MKTLLADSPTAVSLPEAAPVLILSKWEGGGVGVAAAALRDMNLPTVLVSDRPDDRNADRCDAHVTFSWDSGSPDELFATIDAMVGRPAAVINMVEALIPWQVELARHYGLRGGSVGTATLMSKLAVRQVLRDNQLSEVWFTGGPACDVDPAAVSTFPVIVKPSRESGASRFVHAAHSAAELAAILAQFAEQFGTTAEVVVEEYLDGVEFSIDGPVLDGHFHPLYVVEKPGHDDGRHHDAGVLVSPPPTLPAAAAGALAAMLTGLATALELESAWWHAEGRMTTDGRVELLEVNPRPGGGPYRPAIIRTCGVDPLDAMIKMALPGQDLGFLRRARRNELIVGKMPIEADELGVVVDATPVEELKALPGVLEAFVFVGYRVESLDQENFFAAMLLGSDTYEGLMQCAAEARSKFWYRVDPAA